MVEQTYSVKELADISGLSVRTLHHYEGLGLITPQRRENGYRSYTQADAQRLQLVLALHAGGMELSSIGELFASPDYDEYQALKEALGQLINKKRELKRLIASVRLSLASLEQGTALSAKQRFAPLKH